MKMMYYTGMTLESLGVLDSNFREYQEWMPVLHSQLATFVDIEEENVKHRIKTRNVKHSMRKIKIAK